MPPRHRQATGQCDVISGISSSNFLAGGGTRDFREITFDFPSCPAEGTFNMSASAVPNWRRGVEVLLGVLVGCWWGCCWEGVEATEFVCWMEPL